MRTPTVLAALLWLVLVPSSWSDVPEAAGIAIGSPLALQAGGVQGPALHSERVDEESRSYDPPVHTADGVVAPPTLAFTDVAAPQRRPALPPSTSPGWRAPPHAR